MLAVLPVSDPTHPEPRLGEVPEPEPQAGEVLVAVRAAGLNRADLLQIRGLYPPPPGESEIPGLECAGVIQEVGPGVEGWKAGDRVMALLAGGGQAQRVAVPAGQLMRLPDRLSYVEGAAIPEAGLTAWVNLVWEGGLQAGETVLIPGATGGVGTFAVQVARELGATVLAAGRSRERLERLRELGAREVFLDGDGLPQEIRDFLGGSGVNLVVDLVGGTPFPRHLETLEAQGRLVLVGLMAGARAEVDLALLLRRRLRVVGSVLRPRPREEKARLVADFTAFARPRLADGRLRPVVHQVFPFAEIARAYKTLEAGGVFGKIVVEM